MPFKTIVTELLWFLRGDTSIDYLLKNDCHIWDGDAYKNYLKNWEPQKVEVEENPMSWMDQKLTNDRALPQDMFINMIKTDDEFAKKWGDLGPIYGKQWRSWDTWKSSFDDGYWTEIDQIANLINDIKTNPDSRRLMVSAWNVGELDSMVLPPCHYGFQVYTRELSWEERRDLLTKEQFRDEFGYLSPFTEPIINHYLNSKNIPKRAISLMYNARSQDSPLGTPFNISSYALLLEIIGKMVNMVPDELIANMGDCHIYLNQIDGVKEQLTREPYPLPTLKHMKTDEFYKSLSSDLSLLTHLDNTDFVVENYQSHPTIKMPLSN
jgi:thymidylate synthase